MPRTTIDLITEVLDLLGVSQVGQDPSAEDAEVVRRKIPSVLDRLAARRVVYVQNRDSIEDRFFDPLAVIVANNVGPKFGQSYDASTDAVQEAQLREMQREPNVSETVRAEYF